MPGQFKVANKIKSSIMQNDSSLGREHLIQNIQLLTWFLHLMYEFFWAAHIWILSSKQKQYFQHNLFPFNNNVITYTLNLFKVATIW